ncbi:hypothetical protein NXZ75_19560 [Lysinibacillus sphaericus]|uniref:hypothetical protein n=1 Tax=Lysinibacillus sphaericus TaxID=1421 RepID=UPI0021614B9D|nr:hypothetical protein [Lysinibacillus sphaericus]MCS1384397.1 hypothetical protein [Lysinibacillus sphaericus]
MLKRFKHLVQASSLEDGVDLTTKEIKELHMDLTQQLHLVEEAILRAIDRNNYTLFSDLIIERKRIHVVINTIETTLDQTHRRRFFSSTAVATLSTKLDDSLSSINNTSRNITGTVINRVAKGLAYSSQLSEKMQHALQQSSTRLSQLSEQVIHQKKERKNK